MFNFWSFLWASPLNFCERYGVPASVCNFGDNLADMFGPSNVVVKSFGSFFYYMLIGYLCYWASPLNVETFDIIPVAAERNQRRRRRILDPPPELPPIPLLPEIPDDNIVERVQAADRMLNEFRRARFELRRQRREREAREIHHRVLQQDLLGIDDDVEQDENIDMDMFDVRNMGIEDLIPSLRVPYAPVQRRQRGPQPAAPHEAPSRAPQQTTSVQAAPSQRPRAQPQREAQPRAPPQKRPRSQPEAEPRLPPKQRPRSQPRLQPQSETAPELRPRSKQQQAQSAERSTRPTSTRTTTQTKESAQRVETVARRQHSGSRPTQGTMESEQGQIGDGANARRTDKDKQQPKPASVRVKRSLHFTNTGGKPKVKAPELREADDECTHAEAKTHLPSDAAEATKTDPKKWKYVGSPRYPLNDKHM